MQPRPVLTGIWPVLTGYGIGALLYRFRGRYETFRPVPEWNSQLWVKPQSAQPLLPAFEKTTVPYRAAARALDCS
jgi:hypothetical protein